LDDGNGHVCGIKTVQVDWKKDETGRWKMEEVPGSEQVKPDIQLLILNSKFLPFLIIADLQM